MLTIHTLTPAETAAFGVRLGSLLRAGDCVCLAGGLGAGKTALAQGIAAGLSVTEPVTSPTFTVLQVYTGKVPVFHYDLYRLQKAAELLDIGFEEFSGGRGVTLIEWPDKFPEEMPDELLWITLMSPDGGDARDITLTARGARYEWLVKELEQS